jgi:hypothetical protein
VRSYTAIISNIYKQNNDTSTLLLTYLCFKWNWSCTTVNAPSYGGA